MVKHVFVLCTGRCGSLTLERACRHITNYSCAHESRCQYIADERLNYPRHHIEIDNRLCWFLWQLDHRFGDDAVYVHLRRNEVDTAASYHARWYNRGSILRAYTRGILKRDDTSPDISLSLVKDLNFAITRFLANKSKAISIDIEAPLEGFKSFWQMIDAQGDFDAACAVLNEQFNHQGSARGLSDSLNEIQEEDPLVTAEDKLQRAMLELVASERRAENATSKLKVVSDDAMSARNLNRELTGKLNRIETSRVYQLTLALQTCFRSPSTLLRLPVDVYRILNGRVQEDAAGQVNQSSPPRDLVINAADLADAGELESAERRLSAFKTSPQFTVLHLLRANDAVGRHDAWLGHLNAYLGSFDLQPVGLSSRTDEPYLHLSCSVPPALSDQKVSVLMPVYNASATLEVAVRSLLEQSWSEIEIIAVDDCSTDSSFEKLQALALEDSRLIVLQNKQNSGPYVSKNQALLHATGAYITSHDADDWAHPQRLERQIDWMRRASATVCVGGMLRVQLNGRITRFCRTGSQSQDGASRTALVSTLFERDVLLNKLGFWDSVRFAADSEMLSRATKVLGAEAVVHSHDPLMLCLDSPTGLTADPEFGVDARKGVSNIRARYRASWQKWHEQLSPESAVAKLDFPLIQRPFEAPEAMLVDGCSRSSRG